MHKFAHSLSISFMFNSNSLSSPVLSSLIVVILCLHFSSKSTYSMVCGHKLRKQCPTTLPLVLHGGILLLKARCSTFCIVHIAVSEQALGWFPLGLWFLVEHKFHKHLCTVQWETLVSIKIWWTCHQNALANFKFGSCKHICTAW